ncbi:hypothetical protein HYS31_02805 [Candidatus Woesearchaeota archaeon]|nr:hypothetical protein [Candidatus Woesearchaeota archaeon]
MSLETAGASEKSTIEAEILLDIRDAEKKAEETIERAMREKDSIVRDAQLNAHNLLTTKEEELRKLHEKKLSEFQAKAKVIKEEKLAEGKSVSRQLKLKAEKNIPKAIDIVLKKFEEMV